MDLGTAEAASPASTPQAATTKGDGQKTANVSTSEAVRRFVQADTKRSQASATPAPDTSAAAQTVATQPTEATPAQADQPQAEVTQATTTEAASPEATTPEAQAQTTEADGDVLSPESSSLDPKTKERIQKRIDEEVGKRKAQEAATEAVRKELEALKSQLGQQQQVQQAPVAPEMPPAPLPDIKDAKALSDFKSNAKQTVRWAEEVLDRDDIDQGVKVGDQTLSKSDVKAILRNARVALEDQIPAQQEWFQQQTQRQALAQQLTQQARSKFPILSEANSEELKQTRAFFQNAAPSLLQSPAAEWIMGAYIEGVKALMAKEQATQAAAAKPAVPAKPAPKPKAPSDQTSVSTTGSAPRLTPDANSRSAMQAERDRLKASGNASTRTAEQYLARLDAMRNAR